MKKRQTKNACRFYKKFYQNFVSGEIIFKDRAGVVFQFFKNVISFYLTNL